MGIDKERKKKIRILLICSEQTDINYYRHTFKSIGCIFSSTSDPENGFAVFKNYFEHGHPFDIALLDYQLEGTNGISLAKRLKEIFPDVLLMLLPTPLISNADVLKEYREFSGFAQFPDISSSGLTNLVNLAKERKNG